MMNQANRADGYHCSACGCPFERYIEKQHESGYVATCPDCGEIAWTICEIPEPEKVPKNSNVTWRCTGNGNRCNDALRAPADWDPKGGRCPKCGSSAWVTEVHVSVSPLHIPASMGDLMPSPLWHGGKRTAWRWMWDEMGGRDVEV